MGQRALFRTTHTTTIATQEKTQSYEKHILGDDFIPLAIKTYGCFHSSFDFLCLGHYSPSSSVFFNSCDAYFLLFTTCVHSLLVHIGHCNYSTFYEAFFMSSTHWS